MAELLISLAILGEIATFTIPKIITSQAQARYNAAAKEAASTVAAAYQQYTYTNGASSSIGIAALTPYMNYIKVDTSSTVDGTVSNYNCGGGAQYRCLVLHSGTYLFYNPSASFSGTNTTNAVWFGIDPSGADDSITGIGFALTYQGRVLTYGDVDTTYSYSGGGSISPGGVNPSWFSW